MCPTVTHQAVRGQTWSKILYYLQSTHRTAIVVLDAVSGNVRLEQQLHRTISTDAASEASKSASVI